jgi:hypothetical protein
MRVPSGIRLDALRARGAAPLALTFTHLRNGSSPAWAETQRGLGAKRRAGSGV